ncbi:auxilin-like protein [Trifolium pratense]|uniref:Auxilin-like protein n=1 Tax=Trifolium pratense TaxID=57577 RepID=A0A2K3PEF8_TRIPR|nr:auxilin-like protein [Trifolium pratense]
MSSTGVQQGGPLGPLLFALVLHPLIHKIRDNCKLLFHAWYLDDGSVVGNSREVAKALDIIRDTGPRLGLHWEAGVGVKLLGGAVSRDKGFIEGVAMKRVVRAVELIHLLPQLKDAQSELLLLRSCPYFGDLQWRVSSLPIRVGGLGLYSTVEAASYAFVASRAQTWILQDHILRDSGIYGMDFDFNISLDGLRDMLPTFDISNFATKDTVPRKSRHILASGLFTIPVDGLRQHMSPVKYLTILRYRLMITIFPIDDVCSVCRKPCLDQFGSMEFIVRSFQASNMRMPLSGMFFVTF